MKKLTQVQFEEYVKDPLANDAKVRKWADVPDNRYFTVSVYPEHLAGNVFVDNNRFRVVHNVKISKSTS